MITKNNQKVLQSSGTPSCGKCKRSIYTTVSVKKKLGPDCAKKLGQPYSNDEMRSHKWEAFAFSKLTHTPNGGFEISNDDAAVIDALKERALQLERLGIKVRVKEDGVVSVSYEEDLKLSDGSDSLKITPDDIFKLVEDDDVRSIAIKTARRIEKQIEKLQEFQKNYTGYKDNNERVKVMAAAAGVYIAEAEAKEISQIILQTETRLFPKLASMQTKLKERLSSIKKDIRETPNVLNMRIAAKKEGDKYKTAVDVQMQGAANKDLTGLR